MTDETKPRHVIGPHGVPRILRPTEEVMDHGQIVDFDLAFNFDPDPPKLTAKQKRAAYYANLGKELGVIADMLNAPDEFTKGLHMREILRRSGVDVTHMSSQEVYDKYLAQKK